MNHYEKSSEIPANPDAVFNYIDDHSKFSSHMSESSWMMGGGKMTVNTDMKHGKEVGSHIRLDGKVLGMNLYVDEVVTEREPSKLKVWKTVGQPRLLIIGNYEMKVEIQPQNNGSRLTVGINYDLPSPNSLLGKLFGGLYARWCVSQMLNGAKKRFLTI